MILTEHDLAIEALYKTVAANRSAYPKQLFTALNAYHECPADQKTLFALKICQLINAHKPFIPCCGPSKLDDFKQLPLIQIYSALNASNLLEKNDQNANFRTAIAHLSPRQLLLILSTLSQSKLLDNESFKQINFRLAISHSSPSTLIRAIQIADKIGIFKDKTLRQTQFDNLLKHRNIHGVLSGLERLQKLGFFSRNGQKTFALLVTHDEPEELSKGIEILHLRGESSPDNLNVITENNSPYECAILLTTLIDLDLLNHEHAQANRNKIMSTDFPGLLAELLNTLHHYGLLENEAAQIKFNALAQRQDLPTLHEAMLILHKNKLLKGEFAETNFAALIAQKNTSALISPLTLLHDTGLLKGDRGQTNFNELISYSNLLFETPAVRTAWRNIPHHIFNNQHLDAIFDICRRHQNNVDIGRAAFIHYVNQHILNPLNKEQSTHTASVHLTTDLTAWVLSKKYEGHPVPSSAFFNATLLGALEKLKDGTPDIDVFKIDAAIRCIKRLITKHINIELSREKKIKCLQLLENGSMQDTPGLVSLIAALKEDLLQEDSLEDTVINLNHLVAWMILETQDKPHYLEAWINALYEVQRGYNLDEKGQESLGDSQEDDPICYGGTANKLCERLQGLSPLIIFIFISRETFSLKFRQLITHKMMDECNAQLTEIDPNDQLSKARFSELIDKLEDPDRAFECFETLFQNKEAECFAELKEAFPSVSDQEFSKWFLSFKEDEVSYYPPIIKESKDFYGEETLKAFSKLKEKNNSLKENQRTNSCTASKNSFFVCTPTEPSTTVQVSHLNEYAIP